LVYECESKQVELPLDYDGTGTTNFAACKFIAEDYALLGEFFIAAHNHAMGYITDNELPDDFEVY